MPNFVPHRSSDGAGMAHCRDPTMGPTSESDPLSVLLDLTARLTEESNLERALVAVTDAALLLLRADHVSVRLLDPTHTTLLASARSGLGLSSPQVSLRSGEGVAGWVLERSECVRIDDVLCDPRFKPVGGQGFAIRSMVAAPLRASGATVGVLSASGARPAAFDARDALVAQLLANCSVPLLERARLERLAMTDQLTLALGPSQLRPRLCAALESAGEGDRPSLLLMDLDGFKSVNDTHGHTVGDAVLRGFADRVRTLTRQLDVLVRRGGDEFVLLMPATALEQAVAVAERIRQSVASEPFAADEVVIVQTVSIGGATWDGKESAEAFEVRADRALYVA
ncbi:MAG TPA: sensor domain-containing diguanylate cyclase, partial [Polyangiaceae bacterium]|nr:sensor domain-containing diguanylate cyclase [Polyangiaceae bacterium]